ncbi:TrmB family transcriptional regulator [Candidatus Woesearchaeota archaeon]|nr:TrmB family transcriptional regulator [Candidatus Woesearchaeota archaeon]
MIVFVTLKWQQNRKIYKLSRGVSTAGELSDIANVPRSRSYDVLESLEKKGFIIMKLGKPIKYIAVPPNEVLERVKKKIKDNSERELKTIEQLKVGEIINELNLLHTQGIELVEPVDLSGSLKGRDNLYNHLETMIKGAQKSITIMTTTQGLLRKLEILKYTLLKAKQRGVKIRVAAPITKDILSQIKDFSKIAEIKNTNIKARFCLVDGKELTLILLNDESVHPSYDVGVWINTKLFAGALERMFDSEWKRMKAI